LANPPRARRTRRENPSTPLSRERIVAAALALVDREGAGALSMRRLGAELGVDPMAVYYHIPNKEALLDAIVEAVMGEIDLGADRPGAPFEERLLLAAQAYRDVLLAHAQALPVVLSRPPTTPVALRPVEFLVGLLRQAGLPPEQALAGMNAIAAVVRGAVGALASHASEPEALARRQARLDALPAEAYPYLHEAATRGGHDWERDFEFGLRALARGLLGMRG
jgi:AcrR family transcriptional regulator